MRLFDITTDDNVNCRAEFIALVICIDSRRFSEAGLERSGAGLFGRRAVAGAWLSSGG